MSKKSRKFRKSKKKKRYLPKWVIIILITFLVLLVIIGIGFTYSKAYAGSIFPGLKIGKIDLGGITKDEANKILKKEVERFRQNGLTLIYQEDRWDIYPEEIDLTFDIDKTVDLAYDLGHKGGVFEKTKDQILLLLGRKEVGIQYQFSETKLKDLLNQISKKISDPVQDAKIEINNNEVKIIPSKIGKELDRQEMINLIKNDFSTLSYNSSDLKIITVLPQITKNQAKEAHQTVLKLISSPVTLKNGKNVFIADSDTIGSWIKFSKEKISSSGFEYNDFSNSKMIIDFQLKLKAQLDENLIKKYVQKIASKIDSKSINAQLQIKNGKATIFTPDKDGTKLDIDKTVVALKEIFEEETRKIELPVEKLKATVRMETINDLGIKELIGRGESRFYGSPSNRIHNIKVGASKFNGILIKPGETFSFNENKGPIDASAGFVAGLVIKNNKTVPEYGGGLCQVATTFFRAVFWSGVPVLERRPHAYRVGYYDWPYGPGFDATVYGTHPDVKFKNDTESYILIQAYVKGYYLYFDFYGTKGGRTVDKQGPYRYNQKADGSLNTTLYRLVYENGKLKRKDTFSSFYDSPAKYPHLPN